jgi:hypothetical protein
MRLLHTETYKLETFLNNIPFYAILSHTWCEEEVLFTHVTSDFEDAKRLKGWQKVESCCWRAAQDGWQYVWIDTCCINKADTTELGEAINSMFRWYENAQVRYAYLEDVPPRYYASNEHMETEGVPWKWHFRSTRWFKRGWTLQELLAPTYLLFMDNGWGLLGSREEFANEVETATGIAVKHLLDFNPCCLATKLSWAVSRQTTREEDRAYSLLGLLEINMPLIYGEGKRSFIRLQQELIRNYSDETILAWGYRTCKNMQNTLMGSYMIN